jgi:PhnB protein
MVTTITPYLLYEDGAAAMDFLTRAFGFEEVLRSHSPEGRMWHGELRLGDGHVYLGEPGGDFRSPKRLGGATVAVHVYVDDVDAHYERAQAAGAEVKGEPVDRPYGDRAYQVVDPEGHSWFFATLVREVAPQEWGAEVAS